MNKIFVMGRLGQDPEWKPTVGNGLCTFSVATSEKYTSKQGEQKESTQWHNIQVWGKHGEAVARALRKGSEAFVIGKFESRSYEKKDGSGKATSHQINAERVFVGVPSGPAQSQGPSGTGGQPQSWDQHYNQQGSGPVSPPDDDGIPF